MAIVVRIGSLSRFGHLLGLVIKAWYKMREARNTKAHSGAVQPVQTRKLAWIAKTGWLAWLAH